jgi:hypothetical protein
MAAARGTVRSAGSDATSVLDVISATSIDLTATEERAAANMHAVGSAEKTRALTKMKQVEVAAPTSLAATGWQQPTRR